MDLQVLYNRNGLIATLKPAGICSDFHFNDNQPAMETIMRKKFPSYTLLHRLDKWTTGVLMFGDNKASIEGSSSYRWMLSQWHKKVQKTYLAIMTYKGWDEHTCSVPLADEPGKWPRNCRTNFEVLQVTVDGLALVKCTLAVGGRKHQIRKHASILGSPLHGDVEYRGERCSARRGQLLHAYRLAVDLPNPSGYTVLQAPIPNDFRHFGFDWDVVEQGVNKILVVE